MNDVIDDTHSLETVAVEQPSRAARTKVAIVGSAGSKDKTPWDDEEFEIWGLAWRGDLKRFDRMFDMHAVDHTRKKIPEDYKQRLANLRCPVYLIEANSEVPSSVAFPLAEVKEYLKGLDKDAPVDYFASSIAFEFVFAMYEGFKEIHVYGVDLSTDDEWSYQRPNLEYYIGLARGMGIRVYIPDSSALVKFTHVYGYEKDPGPGGVLTPTVLNEMLQEYLKKKDEALVMLHKYDGAIQAIKGQLDLIKVHARGAQIKVNT